MPNDAPASNFGVVVAMRGSGVDIRFDVISGFEAPEGARK